MMGCKSKASLIICKWHKLRAIRDMCLKRESRRTQDVQFRATGVRY